jgi:nucleotide-binding universal stress UspA family protein
MEAAFMSNTSHAHARIVVGVDGSEASQRALQWAVDEARTRGARVEAVYAWHWPYLPTTPFAPFAAPDHDGAEAAARCMLDAAVEAVDAHGLVGPIERVVLWQGAASALLDASRGAEMLVVGSRGRGGFVGLLLGSVSQEVSHHATCPVVIVPGEHANASNERGSR